MKEQLKKKKKESNKGKQRAGEPDSEVKAATTTQHPQAQITGEH